MQNGHTKPKRRYLLPLIVCLVSAVLLMGALLLFGRPAQPPQPQDITAASTGEIPPATSAQTLPPTEESTMPPTQPPAQPEELTQLLAAEGVTFDQLTENGCRQLICVTAHRTAAQIRYFSCREGLWEESDSLSCVGHVGTSGVREEKQEGDGATPTGLYPIREAFYIGQPPQTGLDIFEITPDTYWVDDPDSEFYNQKVEGTAAKDWNSAEHMIDYPVYRSGFTVGYNEEAAYKAGSAIFFHIGDHPTAGCIATEEAMVLAYLEQLDRTANPYILITRSTTG